MNDLGEKWRKILETLNTIIGMLTGYVDDVRQKKTSQEWEQGGTQRARHSSKMQQPSKKTSG